MTALRITTALLCLVLAGCASTTVNSNSVPAIQTSATEVPEDLLLDVSVVVFNPGIEDFDASDATLIYPEVRKAEALYIPGLVVGALEESGAWGAVRIVPDTAQLTDLLVQGEILKSDGEELQLRITATDSRGYVWLEKEYSGRANRYAYRATTRNQHDPFQIVYNNIANDLLAILQELDLADRERIRLVTELLFAQSFSPDAFDGYLAENRTGKQLIMRLPAEDDPMLGRVRKIRDRDRLFVDTLQGYYSSFDQRMSAPYEEWRKASYEEAVALRELKAESRRRLAAGAIAVLAGVAGAIEGDAELTRAAGQLAVIGGGYLLKSGLETRAEAAIHVEALQELGMSLEAEILPQIIELEDRTITLSGNVEEQYNQWRQVLAEIYAAEVGDLAPAAVPPVTSEAL